MPAISERTSQIVDHELDSPKSRKVVLSQQRNLQLNLHDSFTLKPLSVASRKSAIAYGE
jgi:hypothetical protein